MEGEDSTNIIEPALAWHDQVQNPRNIVKKQLTLVKKVLNVLGITSFCFAYSFQFREKEAIRLCLKHFRQKNYNEVFESLQKKTKIQLEHPRLTELHNCLVKDGNYDETEKLIKTAIQGEFYNFSSLSQYGTSIKLIITLLDHNYFHRERIFENFRWLIRRMDKCAKTIA